MQKVTRNTFEKGINTDVDQTKLPPSVYTDAHNVELVGDGDFFALRNVKGTTLEQAILTRDNEEVLGVFENSYRIAGSNKKCLTIFTIEDVLILNASAGDFDFNGMERNLNYSAKINMPANSASFILGLPTANLKTYKLTADSRQFTLTGQAATLTYFNIVNIELYVATTVGSRFNVEFSGVNETKTINRTNTGTTTSTMKLSSSISAKVTKGTSGTESTADNTSIEWLLNGNIQNTESLGTGVVVNHTYTFTSVVLNNTLRVEVIEG